MIGIIRNILVCSVFITSCLSTRTYDDGRLALHIAKARESAIMLQEIQHRNIPWSEKVDLYEKGLRSINSYLSGAESVIESRSSISKYKLSGGLKMSNLLNTIITYGAPFILGMVTGPVLCPKSWLRAIYKKKETDNDSDKGGKING